jgi:hypothetical protein
MSFHRAAKLGLSGRFALVQAVFAGIVVEDGRSRLQGVAGDGAPLARRLRR